MSERDGFFRSIADDAYDDTTRLVFADWLEDNGEPERAEFVRLQCQLEPNRDRFEIDGVYELQDREDELLDKHRKKWLGRMPKGWDDSSAGVSVEFRRGFVDTLSMPVKTFLRMGPKILKLHPTVRRLVMFRVNGYGERLAKCKELEGLAELELSCWYSDEDAEAIADSPHLNKLQVLELWLGRFGELDDRRLCEIVASGKAWPKLRELSLLDPDSEKDYVAQNKRLVAVADKAAGRKIAVYRPGYPDTFPFAEDFWYTFPGYLPIGQMAMAAEDASTDPPTLCVIAFDKNGRQTKKVIRVPMPGELLAVDPSDWFRHKERMKQHLIDTIGFRPGFIRVRDCVFPFDQHGYDRPSWEYCDEIGRVDPEDEESDDGADHECGYGGWASYYVRSQQWVFGWDRYGDKSGTIHST